jgi:hypothetical protein
MEKLHYHKNITFGGGNCGNFFNKFLFWADVLLAKYIHKQESKYKIEPILTMLPSFYLQFCKYCQILECFFLETHTD